MGIGVYIGNLNISPVVYISGFIHIYYIPWVSIRYVNNNYLDKRPISWSNIFCKVDAFVNKKIK